MEPTTVRWQGPYNFVPEGAAKAAFDLDEAKCPGVYLWTIPYNGGFLINYVGESRNVAARLYEHSVNFLSGKYTFYEPASFLEGNKDPIYHPSCGLSKLLAEN